jgi:hypothetical protein
MLMSILEVPYCRYKCSWSSNNSISVSNNNSNSKGNSNGNRNSGDSRCLLRACAGWTARAPWRAAWA